MGASRVCLYQNLNHRSANRLNAMTVGATRAVAEAELQPTAGGFDDHERITKCLLWLDCRSLKAYWNHLPRSHSTRRCGRPGSPKAVLRTATIAPSGSTP